MGARSRRRSGLAGAVALACVVVFAALLAVRLTSSSSASAARQTALEAAALPAPARPAFVVPAPRRLTPSRAAAHWAPVIRAVPVRIAPDSDARVIASLATRTPERTTNVVAIAGRATDKLGRLWIAVRVPALPTNSTGWVLRRALGAYSFVRTRLVVDVERLTATLFDDGRPVFRARIGVGRPSSPTPTGAFYIRSKLISFRSDFYGPLAFGTSARSPVLTDWPDGGFIGIHGTDHPELLPGRVSHGCVRMRNDDILELGRLMPVGTPVLIR